MLLLYMRLAFWVAIFREGGVEMKNWFYHKHLRECNLYRFWDKMISHSSRVVENADYFVEENKKNGLRILEKNEFYQCHTCT